MTTLAGRTILGKGIVIVVKVESYLICVCFGFANCYPRLQYLYLFLKDI